MMIIWIVLFFPWAIVRCEQYREMIFINRLNDFPQQFHKANLINRLNDFLDFDHNIILLDSSLDLNLYFPINENGVPRTLCNFGDNSNNNTQLAALKTVTSKNTFLIVIGTPLAMNNNKKLWAHIERIGRMNYDMKIGIFFVRQNPTAMSTIEELFRWSWRVGIANIFCAFYLNDQSIEALPSFNVFRFDPFVPLINITENESTIQNYFPNKLPNYHKRPIRFVHDYMILTHEIQFWDTVCHVFNATRTMVYMNLAIDGFRNTDMFFHELVEKPDLYPHRMASLVLLVPHARPYSTFVAYLRNATWTLIFIYAFVAITTASIVLIISDYLRTKEISYQCAFDVLNLVMNDNSSIRYGQLHFADVCVIVPLTFIGFVAMNGILSVFQSYLTWPIYERQINSFDDLFKSSVQIYQHYSAGLTIDLLEFHTGHGGWNDRIHEIEDVQLYKEISSFNDSIAYVLNYERQGIQVYLEVQKRLSLKAYHLISEPLLQSLVSFSVSSNFSYTGSINDIIHRLNNAGLMSKWIKDTDDVVINDLMKSHYYRELKVSNKTDSEDFVVPTLLWSGWIASGILFVCEIIWKKFTEVVRTKVGNCRFSRIFGHYSNDFSTSHVYESR